MAKEKGAFIFFGIMGAIALGPTLIGNYLNDQRKQKNDAFQARCDIDPRCREAREDEDAKTQSLMGPQYIVRSESGRLFFRGLACIDTCIGEVEGYRWAKSVGVTQESACNATDNARKQGCLLGVRERIDELAPSDTGYESPPLEPSQPP